MFLGIFNSSLDRIDSLRFFYLSQLESIEKVKKELESQNQWGFQLDMFFSVRAMDNAIIKDLPQYKELEAFANGEVEIIDCYSPEDLTRVCFKIKKKDELLSKGIELNPKKAAAAYGKAQDMPIIHGSNTLIMLITRFEEFIANCFREIYSMFPQKYINEKNISYNELLNAGFENIKDFIIQREVDALMRESYQTWFKLFKSHGMSLSACEQECAELGEIYARRNVLVHNSGVVNNQYMKGVANPTAKLGDKLYADEKYLENAFSAIRVIMYTVCIEATRLIDEESRCEYIEELFASLFDELCVGNYGLCKRLFPQIMANKSSTEAFKALSQFNYWIAASEIDGLESIKREVLAYDVSAMQEQFKLAKEILLRNYSVATAILNSMYTQHKISIEELDSWPLFKHYRESKEYIEFKNEHGIDQAINSIEISAAIDTANNETGLTLCAIP